MQIELQVYPCQDGSFRKPTRDRKENLNGQDGNGGKMGFTYEILQPTPQVMKMMVCMFSKMVAGLLCSILGLGLMSKVNQYIKLFY